MLKYVLSNFMRLWLIANINLTNLVSIDVSKMFVKVCPALTRLQILWMFRAFLVRSAQRFQMILMSF